MRRRSRYLFLSCVAALACSSPESGLFSPGGEGPSHGGSSNSAGSSLGGTGEGAVGSGGAGTNSGAMPSGASGGAAPNGEGGAPTTDMGGAGDGEAGGPTDLPGPVCGNGTIEGDEECDDGGQAGQDGCTAECQVDCSDFDEDAVESADHHCYAGYDEATFEGAQADCVRRGAHLVTISSPDENELAASFVASSKFIGGFERVGNMMAAAGTYEWVTGEPFAYENWDDDQPDRDNSRCNGFTGPVCYEHCAAIDDDGIWMDQRCDVEDGYVCEWEPAGS